MSRGAMNKDVKYYCTGCQEKEQELAKREVYTREMELAAANAIKELTTLKKLVIKYRRCLFKPYNPAEVDNDEFYEYDRQIEQAVKEE